MAATVLRNLTHRLTWRTNILYNRSYSHACCATYRGRDGEIFCRQRVAPIESLFSIYRLHTEPLWECHSPPSSRDPVFGLLLFDRRRHIVILLIFDNWWGDSSLGVLFSLLVVELKLFTRCTRDSLVFSLLAPFSLFSYLYLLCSYIYTLTLLNLTSLLNLLLYLTLLLFVLLLS